MVMVNGSYEDVLLYLFFLESCSRRPFQSIAESHSSKSEREHPLPPRSFLEIEEPVKKAKS
jgi:hypothetical protein